VLTERRKTILKSIVGQYIMKATPVASQSIVDDYELSVSPATIRNEMALLEEEGYILRQHTSAGSIPSDKGYRYYVESLGEIELPLAEQRLVSHLFHQVEGELEEWLKLAAKIIAQLAQNMAVVTTPRTASCEFKYLELVSLQSSLALGIFVLRGASIRRKLIALEQAVSQSELSAIADKLNAAYTGLTRTEITAKKMELSPLEAQLGDCLQGIMRAEDEQEHEELYLDGLHFILRQPEFASSQLVNPLLELVDERSLIKIIIPEKPSGQEVQVIIGKEHKAEMIQNCSVVIGRYGLPSEATGTIGIIGPTRMPYARAISSISYLSSVLSRLTAELYGRVPPGKN
jgi:heat-inducible transcriptional repressor